MKDNASAEYYAQMFERFGITPHPLPPVYTPEKYAAWLRSVTSPPAWWNPYSEGYSEIPKWADGTEGFTPCKKTRLF